MRRRVMDGNRNGPDYGSPAGKGDTDRVEDKKKFDEGYAACFSNCGDHPDYKVMGYPMADCIVCRRLWREKMLDDASSRVGTRHKDTMRDLANDDC